MKSLVCYNIFTQEITYLKILEEEKININSFFNFIRAGWRNGDIVCCIDEDWRDFSYYQLKCMCRESLLPIVEKEINPFGG